MRERVLGKDWAIALIAGYVATKVSDRAQRTLWHATPPSLREREPDLPDGSSSRSAARRLCELCGLEPNEQRLRTMKLLVHYGLGLGWGSVYGFLRRQSRMRPLGAGIVTGTSLSLLIDEALNPALGITPPSREYPASAHIRGFLNHLIYGFAVALTAESLYRLTRRNLDA